MINAIGTPPENEKEEKTIGDVFTHMSRDDMQRYIRKNKLNVVLINKMSDDDARVMLRDYNRDDTGLLTLSGPAIRFRIHEKWNELSKGSKVTSPQMRHLIGLGKQKSPRLISKYWKAYKILSQALTRLADRGFAAKEHKSGSYVVYTKVKNKPSTYSRRDTRMKIQRVTNVNQGKELCMETKPMGVTARIEEYVNDCVDHMQIGHLVTVSMLRVDVDKMNLGVCDAYKNRIIRDAFSACIQDGILEKRCPISEERKWLVNQFGVQNVAHVYVKSNLTRNTGKRFNASKYQGVDQCLAHDVVALDSKLDTNDNLYMKISDVKKFHQLVKLIFTTLNQLCVSLNVNTEDIE